MLYYTPQILEQAGVAVLLSNMGLKSDSASLLSSLLASFLMLPCIVIAMRLMDVTGRRLVSPKFSFKSLAFCMLLVKQQSIKYFAASCRSILLYTIPVLIVSLLALVLSNVVNVGSTLHAIISAASVISYISFFVMGFGPVPNIFCSEIFPTSIRGLCITICALTFWFGDIAITYLLPVMLNSLGLAGVFTIFAFACIVSWIFVFLKVPETKGMPLEVISEFFAVGATAIPKND